MKEVATGTKIEVDEAVMLMKKALREGRQIFLLIEQGEAKKDLLPDNPDGFHLPEAYYKRKA